MGTPSPRKWRHTFGRLVRLAVVFGLAALFAPESPAQQTSPRQDEKALLRGWEVAKGRMYARPGAVRLL
ncbi:MAG: hypothetical protein M3361_12215, partial [Candidatus Tectomicrobia bacterium]|nr:hypothetical protein [Candidatus Tectomicrobia bacterium]